MVIFMCCYQSVPVSAHIHSNRCSLILPVQTPVIIYKYKFELPFTSLDAVS